MRTIRRLENNSSGNPRIGTVQLLAKALELGPEDYQRLLATTGSAPPPVEAEAPPEAQPPRPQLRPQPPVRRTARQPALDEAAEQLAQAVERRWQREEEHRRVHDPFQLPVRFQPVADGLIDPRPGAAQQLTGGIGDLADSYRRIPSGHLVVLGRPGSGKTILALRSCWTTCAVAKPTSPSR